MATPLTPVKRLAAGLGLVLVLLGIATAPARADPLADLVDRYVAWRGGPAFEHLSTVHVRAKLESAGLSGVAESWVARDGRQRGVVDLGVVRQTQVISPASSWDTTPSGQIQDVSDADLKSARRDTALEFADALRGRDGAHPVLAANETLNGRLWAVVRITFGDEDVYDVFLDPKTGEIGGERRTENRRVRTETFSDWRVVDGVRMPFLIADKTDVPGGDSTALVTEVELNQTFDDKLFARPGAVHRATFRAGATSSGWIAFEFFDGDRIYFPARVNGHDTIVLLDSGAETSVIDRAYARAIGLKGQGGVPMMGSGGTDTASLIPGVKIEVGTMTLSDLTIAGADIEAVGKRMGHPLPFVLGDEVFNELAVDIDFAGRRIAFRDPAHLDKPDGAREVPLRLTQGIRSVPVSIEGGAPIQVDFDIGNGSPLLIYPAYYEKTGMLAGRRTSQALGGAIGGFHAQTMATVKRLTFAGVDFDNVPTDFPPATNSAVNVNVAQGNLGLPVIERFRVVADFPHDRLWLTPDPTSIAAPFRRDRLGMSMSERGEDLVVEFVAPGSPAEAAGFKTGERVTLIDRKPRSAWPGESLRALGGEAPGTAVEFTLSTGEERRLKLADYF
jgi:hypothetical protein